MVVLEKRIVVCKVCSKERKVSPSMASMIRTGKSMGQCKSCSTKGRSITHGLTGTPIYMAWARMKTRCYDKNYPEYFRWGGRGITVCEKWHEFENFYADMNDGFNNSLSLERIDNNKGYYRENCRWATSKEQANNRKGNRFVEWNGLRKTISQWAEWAGVNSSVFRGRFYCLKWEFEKCLFYKKESVA